MTKETNTTINNMPEPFKNLFSRSYFDSFIPVVQKVVPDFEGPDFLKALFDDLWEERELKQRARHTALTLKDHLFPEYKKNVEIILKIIDYIQNDTSIKPGIEAMFFPDFIECFGLEDYETSIHAMGKMTCFFSCEFSIRPFIIRYPERTMNQMADWSQNPHPMVRRLSSEGCRPRLPWAMAIPFLKRDPSPIIPILENLKNDESETVRRSVANNLNDIAKDNPDVVISLVKAWKGQSKNVDWVVKHGSRTLLKQAHPEIMSLFGFEAIESIEVNDLKILTPVVRTGESLEFAFTIHNRADKEILIRLEYGMYYLKANGTHSRKVFKISEKNYPANRSINMTRKQSFRLITTRKFYPGLHKLSLIVNGKETHPVDFELVDLKP